MKSERSVWRKEMGAILTSTIALALFWKYRETIVHSVVYAVVWLMYRREDTLEWST